MRNGSQSLRLWFRLPAIIENTVDSHRFLNNVYLLKQLQKEKLDDQYLESIIYKAYYLDMFNHQEILALSRF